MAASSLIRPFGPPSPKGEGFFYYPTTAADIPPVLSLPPS